MRVTPLRKPMSRSEHAAYRAQPMRGFERATAAPVWRAVPRRRITVKRAAYVGLAVAGAAAMMIGADIGDARVTVSGAAGIIAAWAAN